jgi:hypothetical protein
LILPSSSLRRYLPAAIKKSFQRFDNSTLLDSECAIRVNAYRLSGSGTSNDSNGRPVSHCCLLPLASSLTSHFDVSRIPETWKRA